MNGKETELPSQSGANALTRVIVGKPLKYTIVIHKADGSAIEFQSQETASLIFDTEARALWIKQKGYEGGPIMAWEPGMIILVEENPK